MDSTPDSRDADLVRRIIVGSPLKSDRLGGADFICERREGVSAQAVWKPPGARDPGHRFGRRAAESAVTGDVTGKTRRHERLLLISHPIFRVNPFDPADLVCRVRRLAGPA